MKPKTVILKIHEDKVWFNEEEFLSFSQTNIPYKHLIFKKVSPIYWLAEQENFVNNEKLVLTVSNYQLEDYSTFSQQRPKKKIKAIEFGKFDWSQLEHQLSFYKKSAFLDQLIGEEINTEPIEVFNEAETPFGKAISEEQFKKEFLSKQTPSEKTDITHQFTVDFSSVKIKLGHLEFYKYVPNLDESFCFVIFNDNLLPEFDYVKYWFSKSLKLKKLKVTATFYYINGELDHFSCISKDVDRINQTLIEGVKVQRTLSLIRKVNPPEMDQSLFTAEDIFEKEKDDSIGNVFAQTEKEILETLLEFKNIRNRKELSYLSGKIHSSAQKLRFTNTPYFGFIFYHKGEINHHFLWELLNSHATYIWSMDQSKLPIHLAYKRIERSINSILENGRDTYKRAYKHFEQDNDLIFNVVSHENKESKFIDAFPKWKYKIDEKLS